nr:MAG TPA: hypothetical protein [Caudoviricetes sp.]
MNRVSRNNRSNLHRGVGEMPTPSFFCPCFWKKLPDPPPYNIIEI